MKFDKLINNLLIEEELSDRERRIQALKNIKKTIQCKVLFITTCRGETDIENEIILEGTDIETISVKAKEMYIDLIRGDFEDADEDEDTGNGLQGYIDDWFHGPVISDDYTVAGIVTGEESAIIIISESSKYFYYSEDELIDNMGEIDGCLDWS